MSTIMGYTKSYTDLDPDLNLDLDLDPDLDLDLRWGQTSGAPITLLSPIGSYLNSVVPRTTSVTE